MQCTCTCTGFLPTLRTEVYRPELYYCTATGGSWPRWAALSPPIFFRIIQAPPNLTTILHIENITTKATILVAAKVLRIKRTGAMEFPTSREIIQQTWATIPRLAVVRTQPSMASPHMVVIILSSSIISSTSQEAVISTNSVLNNSAITDRIPTHICKVEKPAIKKWRTTNLDKKGLNRSL